MVHKRRGRGAWWHGDTLFVVSSVSMFILFMIDKKRASIYPASERSSIYPAAANVILGKFGRSVTSHTLRTKSGPKAQRNISIYAHIQEIEFRMKFSQGD